MQGKNGLSMLRHELARFCEGFRFVGAGAYKEWDACGIIA